MTQNFSHFCRRDFFFCPENFWIAELAWWGFNTYIRKENLNLHVGHVYVACKTWFVSIKYDSFTSGFLLNCSQLAQINQTKGLDHFWFSELDIGRTLYSFQYDKKRVTFEIPLLWLYGFFSAWVAVKASRWTWICKTGWQVVNFYPQMLLLSKLAL